MVKRGWHSHHKPPLRTKRETSSYISVTCLLLHTTLQLQATPTIPNRLVSTSLKESLLQEPEGTRRSQQKGHESGVRGSLGWGIAHRSHISVCCSLIPTALYYNAQMDADLEPSKSVLGTVPACNLPVRQRVCGLQWLHSWATCRHHELLQTWAPHQELRLHGGRRCAYPTAVQPHAMVPNNWW